MKILDFLKENILYLDGGMGTLLQAEGLQAGELPEDWNLTHPEVITRLHKAYYDAGSHVVNTNTFGANTLKFTAEALEATVRAAVENARRAAAESSAAQPKWVALDIGPTGRMLKPYGDLDFEDAVAAFAATVRLGVKYGVDLIMIETMNDSYETKAAVLAAKENSDLPIFVSNAYGADGKLMTGADPRAMVALLEGLCVDAIGVNCSLGPKALAPIVEEYLAASSLPVLLKPNAGLPKVEDGKTVFDVLPEVFAADVAALLEKGVRVAGGCCGTTPAYIAALTDAAKAVVPVPVLEKNISCVSSYTHAVAFGEKPLLIGERINPTGKKRFKEALRAGDIDYILQEGISQEEKGVHILDVNVGLPEIDEISMLTAAVTELQAVSDTPLQIDTANAFAMEAALRRYNGKALLNSVNGKAGSMDAVFPLAEKYGGMVVALTLDESGIPATAEGRVEIAERILAEAAKYGIAKKDLLFDPLALTVSADDNAARETLRAVRMLRERGCLVSLGVSNVSFGLPERDIVNGTFFALALGQGLSAAIMNPYSAEMQKAYRTYLALAGLDPACGGYIEYASALPKTETVSTATAGTTEEDYASELQKAIVKGRREQAAALAAALSETCSPLDIINGEIVPALDTVGVGFENKTVYLPQLLMAAEAAKAAFEALRARMEQGAADKCAVILATVKGDIHDIGKNIVGQLLENYGFAVTDLGRDVAPETIADAAERLHAPLVGLSALMTTTVPAMEATVKLLRRRAPWCRVMVGGAVLTAEYAEAIGADFCGKDAMSAVRYAENLNLNIQNG